MSFTKKPVVPAQIWVDSLNKRQTSDGDRIETEALRLIPLIGPSEYAGDVRRIFPHHLRHVGFITVPERSPNFQHSQVVADALVYLIVARVHGHHLDIIYPMPELVTVISCHLKLVHLDPPK